MSEQLNNRDDVCRMPPHGTGVSNAPNAASGDAAYNTKCTAAVRRLPPAGVPNEPPPRRLRRMHRVWPDRNGNISYLLTMCVDERARVLDNETTFERFVAFLLDSPTRYHWFGRRFVSMPDHIHLIAHEGHDAVRLGQWIKALKTVVGGLQRREPDAVSGDARNAGSGAYSKPPADVVDAGRLPSAGGDVGRAPKHGATSPSTGGDVGRVPSRGATSHEFTRIKRTWRWQDGFHDHKFRTPESEARKWEYVCLNPVRAGLVKRPEEWPFGGEIFYDEAGGPRLVRGTPPLLETGMLVEEDRGTTTGEGGKPPAEGNRPTT